MAKRSSTRRTRIRATSTQSRITTKLASVRTPSTHFESAQCCQLGLWQSSCTYGHVAENPEKPIQVEEDPLVEHAHQPLTMHFGPNEILINMAVQFRPEASSDSILDCIAKLESRIRETFPSVRRIFIEAESLKEHRRAPVA